MENTVALVVGIAWPVATVWIAYLFKGEIKRLFSRMSQLKYSDLEAKFDKDLTDAELNLKKVEMNLRPSLEPSEIASKAEALQRIASISPRAAVMEAWTLIETSAFKAGLAQGTAKLSINTKSILDHLEKSGKISHDSLVLVEKLRQIRNKAAHHSDFYISYEEAERYLELAVKCSEILGSAASERR